ncbi:hypothetical protein RJT34_18925 [Clitoria ternatea]|uniref:Uncharacterized protein n=1 Tax=Clitoria ternatea TaxID=43366 RepID=A0AAN9IQI3_CLITE
MKFWLKQLELFVSTNGWIWNSVISFTLTVQLIWIILWRGGPPKQLSFVTILRCFLINNSTNEAMKNQFNQLKLNSWELSLLMDDLHKQNNI